MFRRCRGSFTVEAALVMPLVLFMMIAVFYLLLFARDRAVLQSAAYEMGEAALYESGTAADAAAAMTMMQVDALTCGRSESVIGRVIRLLTSTSHSDVDVSGRVPVLIPGTAHLLGGQLKTAGRIRQIAVDYRSDRLKTVLLNRLKE